MRSVGVKNNFKATDWETWKVWEKEKKGTGLTYVLVLVVFGGEGVTKRRMKRER